MSLRINQNTLSISTYGVVSNTSNRLEKSVEKLSSGLRINRAADDAAGLAISEKLRRQVRGLARAILNAQDGISMIQSAEGALNESHSILQRMRELALQSCNDTLTSNDRLEIQKEVNQLRDDLNRIARNTEFNTKKLLDGSQTALISASSNGVNGLVSGVGQGSGDYDVSITLLTGGISQMLRSQIFTINGTDSTLAKGTTQLQSIAQFYDSNGVFVIDNPQTITFNGNSKSSSFTIDGQMSLDKVAAAMQNALVSNSALALENSKVQVINTTQTNISNLGGYIQITSGSIGEAGNIAISTDQAVLNSLGISIVREAKNNLVEITTKDNYGNLRQIRTETQRARGLLDGVDLKFAAQAGQIAGTKGLEAGLYISGDETFDISAGGLSATITISGCASGYWTLEGIARSINAQVAGIGGLTANVVEGEIRLSYEPTATVAVGILSNILILNATNATTLGFANGTFAGFTDSAKDVQNVEWGFSAFDQSVTSYATIFSLSDGNNSCDITAYASVTVVTSVDMVRFITFQSSVNTTLNASSVKMRIDQIGGAMAFTSLRVGQENRDGLDAFTSYVSLSLSATTSTAGWTTVKNLFGILEGSTKGSGDKNFRVHVVDNTPQFQIGADEGQIMKISMCSMTAESLDVDNLDVTSVDGANASLGKISMAVDMVSDERAKLGAFQNRLENSVSNLRNTHDNAISSESRIRDVDVASEMVEFTRDQIVSQSGMAMLAQANLIPQGVLALLK